MRHLALSLTLLSLLACSAPFAGYEVPTLPEERIGQRLNMIAHGLVRGDLDMIMKPYREDFSSKGFTAGTWETDVSRGGIDSRQWKKGEPSDIDRAGIREFWQNYMLEFPAISRAEIKPRETDALTELATCTYYADIKGLDNQGRFRNDRMWIEFRLRLEKGTWSILSQRTLRGDSAVGMRTFFRDIARENGTAYSHNASPAFAEATAVTQEFPLVVRGDCGLSTVDYDGDGWIDLYYCDGLRNALLRNKGDGTFEDVTKKAGLDPNPIISRSAIFFDADNDGDMDLFITYEKVPCRLYENKGDGTFQNRSEGSGLQYNGFPTSLAVADINNDGLLDLYVACYGDFYARFPNFMKMKDGEANVLFKNLGNLKFKDISSYAGVGDPGWTLACTFGDYDNDGDPDLFVCNDFGDNSLYRNEGGWFVNVTYTSGIRVRGFGMSSSFGDYDNDGDLDVYLSGMYSNAGQWIFKREELLPVPNYIKHIREKVMGMLDYMTDGNRLLRNNGDGTFTELAAEAGVSYGQFAWGSPFIDFDNDGNLDLYCNNGFWSGPDTQDL